jgi:hypothetical protein
MLMQRCDTPRGPLPAPDPASGRGVRNGGGSFVSAREGARNLAVMEAVRTAVVTGTTVVVAGLRERTDA